MVQIIIFVFAFPITALILQFVFKDLESIQAVFATALSEIPIFSVYIDLLSTALPSILSKKLAEPSDVFMNMIRAIIQTFLISFALKIATKIHNFITAGKYGKPTPPILATFFTILLCMVLLQFMSNWKFTTELISSILLIVILLIGYKLLFRTIFKGSIKINFFHDILGTTMSAITAAAFSLYATALTLVFADAFTSKSTALFVCIVTSLICVAAAVLLLFTEWYIDPIAKKAQLAPFSIFSRKK